MGFEGKMKWYKFLTYFYIWLMALFGVFSVISATGIVQVCFLVITVLLVMAGIGMLSYKWNGVLCLLGAYVLNQILGFIMDPNTIQITGCLIAFCIIIPLNFVYFNKRRGLFS